MILRYFFLVFLLRFLYNIKINFSKFSLANPGKICYSFRHLNITLEYHRPGRSAARLARVVWDHKVGGSNPLAPTIIGYGKIH